MTPSFFKQNPFIHKLLCICAILSVTVMLFIFASGVLAIAVWTTINISSTAFELWQIHNLSFPTFTQIVDFTMAALKVFLCFLGFSLLFTFMFSMTQPKPTSTMR